MINAVIIEGEAAAQENLWNTLKEVAPDLNVKAILSSVKESVAYFRDNLFVDIILCDVQLPDGLSFEIFKKTNLKIPVIFITGYDKFNLHAFDNNGIDYLPKPIKNNDLAKSIDKYKMLAKHFTQPNQSLGNYTGPQYLKKKTRLLVKKGAENISIKLADAVMFYAQNKLVYAMDKSGNKFCTDKTLNELEEELDTSTFFRANRQYIINLDFVKGYKPFEKVKLQVALNVDEKANHSIIVSQNTAPVFRKWISEA